jgi:HK97 family phage portal protein
LNILRKMANAVVRSLSLTKPQDWRPDGERGDAGELVNGENVLGLSAVWACVNLIAGTIASLPLMVYRTNADGSREVAKDHPLYRTLHDSPNYDQTAVDFWEFISASLELWGNAYARIERTAGKVVGLYPIAPNLMTVRRLPNGSIEYRWTQDGKSYTETDQKVLHIRGFGGNPLGGLSTMHFGRNTFSLARAVDRSAASMFKNGLRPSGVLTFEKWLTAEQRQIAEDKLTEKYYGAMNSGRPLILEGGTKWEQLTISPEDAQMLESRGFSVEEICRFFGTPPFMIGHTEKTSSWGTGLEQQTLGFQKFTLRRRLKRIEQACEKQLLTPSDIANGVSIEFNLEGLLRADTAGRARFYQQMTGIGAMTINEVRALENLPPVEGGNVPRMQMQNVPITEIDEEAVRRIASEANGASA